jgi:putative N6-adenine-specific DNA methylase
MQEAETLYREMGKHFSTLDSWQIYVLTSHEGFERLYGRRADKVRKLYNGMIPCSYYQFFKPKDDRQIVRPRSCNYQGERRGGDKPPFEKKNRQAK